MNVTFVNAAFLNAVQCTSVRKIRIRKICAVCPVRVDIKKSGNNKAAVRIERFAFVIGRIGIVASAQCSYCAVKLDAPRLQSAGEQQDGIFDKKTFHYIEYSHWPTTVGILTYNSKQLLILHHLCKSDLCTAQKQTKCMRNGFAGILIHVFERAEHCFDAYEPIV